MTGVQTCALPISLISAESGLCLKDAVYEAGRVADVLMFGANECLKDNGQIFSCDITPHGRQRRVFTQRDPLLGVISAITPFNLETAVGSARVGRNGVRWQGATTTRAHRPLGGATQSACARAAQSGV